jgi:cytochrome P450
LSIFIRTIILAGHETTSSTLSWALFELTRHSDIQDKLRAEIHEKIAEKGNNIKGIPGWLKIPWVSL